MATAVEVIAEGLHASAQAMTGYPAWAQANAEERQQALTQAQHLTYPWYLSLLREAGFAHLSQVTEAELTGILYEGLLNFGDREQALAQGWAKSYYAEAQASAHSLQAAGLLA